MIGEHKMIKDFHELYSDASTKYIGGYVKMAGFTQFWQMPSVIITGVEPTHRNINILEAVAALLTLWQFFMNIKRFPYLDKFCKQYLDNKSVGWAFASYRTTLKNEMFSRIIMIKAIIMYNNSSFLEYIPSIENKLADKISRVKKDEILDIEEVGNNFYKNASKLIKCLKITRLEFLSFCERVLQHQNHNKFVINWLLFTNLNSMTF